MRFAQNKTRQDNGAPAGRRRSGFVSGHRFSDVVKSSKSDAPLGAGRHNRRLMPSAPRLAVFENVGRRGSFISAIQIPSSFTTNARAIHHRHPTRSGRQWRSDWGSQKCARLPRRPSKLPQTHFQRIPAQIRPSGSRFVPASAARQPAPEHSAGRASHDEARCLRERRVERALE
jgi:hypothetical protein